MKVLIADFDLYNKVGGGQTFYRSVIQKNPEINFYYIADDEALDNSRPENAYPIPYKKQILVSDLNGFFDITPPKWIYRSFVKASNIAASVANQQFDVIDVPDYEQWGVLLRPALTHYNVNFGKIVLSMHGVISTTLRLDWFIQGKRNIPLNLEEKMQYKTVDLRYAISKDYINEWQVLGDFEAYYYHPLHFFDLPKPTQALSSINSPNLNFIGRTEKRKGPDIFIDLAWWLPRSSYEQVSIIGPHSYNDTSTKCSKEYLDAMLYNRLEDVAFLAPKTRPELAELFASKSITLLPSRYDTLNLLAIESLFSGCPTAIGNGAGVCRLLKENFPHIPFVEIDINNIYACLPQLQYILENYDEYRQKLVDAVLNSPLEVDSPDLNTIYQNPEIFDSEIRNQLDSWYSQLMGYWLSTQEGGGIANLPVIRALKLQLIPIAKQAKQNLKKTKVQLQSQLTKPLEDSRNFQTAKSPFLVKQYKAAFNNSEQTEKDLAYKIKQCWNIGETLKPEEKGIRAKMSSGYRIDRVRLWREIARVEELRGNDLVAATYKLRGIRLLGRDNFSDLPYILRILEGKGFHREAIAIDAMYGKPSEQEKRCLEYVKQAYEANLTNPERDYELFDDRREKSDYRASIIVSLYNAADKLSLFLKTLEHQTLIQKGEAEVILVDSGSPDEEYKVFLDLAPQLNIPLLYVRSEQRETIQSAWNRGISLTKSPYLAFLGVDETILPDCLEVLASELDKDLQLDWVIGHSLVTNVDQKGSWVGDIMPYDRTGYHQNLVYLETCYLSWVGALYRRSIHDRFGYYDSTFRGAGDTEFKSRLLPYLKTKVVDRTLGVFWNYPDERTTQSPAAEIEDMRAWYIHRTSAGVKYGFSQRSVEELEKLFYSALCYRKSYCGHTSSDLDYAYQIGLYLKEIAPNSETLQYFEGVKTLLNLYRSLDWIPKISRFSPLSHVLETRKLAQQIEQEHRRLWQPNNHLGFEPTYQIFNDNRHEQHSFLWFTPVINLD